MQLENKFTIAAPIEEAWAALNNPETVAPCFPGATLTEYEDDSFTGTVKVKLGPISLTYKGKGTYVERDDANHKVVIDATGRDSRGNGTAAAKVTGSMVAQGPDKTEVTMVTDLSITGRPAQFGRGVISDVSEKIIGQFASCLTDKLGASGAAAADAAPSADAPAAAAPTSAPTSATAGSEAPKPVAAPKSTPTGGPLRSEVDAIDLLDSAGAPVLKRLAPVVGVLGALLAIFVVVRRLRSK
ncbi:SRPBCC family protein [Pseudonocardia sp.]|jgi:carbon monoxide dehydrogenase subunit G|uniref:SRPBCC family protein n=1 Tax=Pseudonocardia sp. TaxID=60912 RepID=UPI003D124BFA